MSITYLAAMKEPLLAVEQEREALRKWQEDRDRNALELLLRSHARQAWSQASRWTDNPVHLEDLVAEGMIGLMRAADNFNRDMDVRFATYSSWWVMTSISTALSRVKTVIDIPPRAYIDARMGRLKGEDGGLPSTVSKYGSTKQEIFICYEDLKAKYGKEVENFPLGAIGIYSAGEKLRVGLQQLMAGARKWNVEYMSRDDLASLTEECAMVTGIPYIMDAYREEALSIIDAV